MAKGDVAPPAEGKKVVRYLGRTYEIPLWMSASTFVKRVRAGQDPGVASHAAPLSASARGRMGRAKSSLDVLRRREIANHEAQRGLAPLYSQPLRVAAGGKA